MTDGPRVRDKTGPFVFSTPFSVFWPWARVSTHFMVSNKCTWYRGISLQEIRSWMSSFRPIKTDEVVHQLSYATLH